jgi:hypothetical protein
MSTAAVTNRSDKHTQGVPRPLRVLEKPVLAHFAALMIFMTWAFGGQASWVREVIVWWGTLGMGLFAAACWLQSQAGPAARRPIIRYLWPLLGFDLLVIASCFNPNFKEVLIGNTSVLVMGDPKPWLPSSARPALSLRELWQFNGLVLTCFTLYLVLPSRRRVRGVLFLMAGNAVVLAVFGTFQKLIHAEGLWFGLVKSPNPKFFATFIYHNHWGAFTILNTAICLGLLYHFIRRGGHRDFWHSPALLGGVLTLLFAASVPLSASRSSTVLMAALLGGALIHLLLRLIRSRRERHESAWLPVTGVIAAAVLGAAAVGYVGREVIAQRAQITAQQLSHIAKEDTLNSRLVLYRDTWRMAAEKPWFGWGLESYAHVFRVFNSQRAVEVWFGQPFYAEAHNDWLQSLAEVGFVGTALLALLLGVPLFSTPWRRLQSTLPRYLLAGCLLILAYAWLEFPFANPAVMLTFAATFYCALRYAELDLADQAPANPS